MFNDLDPPAASVLTFSDLLEVRTSGELLIELSIVIKPSWQIFQIQITTDNVFDPLNLNFTKALYLTPSDPSQTIGIGNGASGDFNLDQETLDQLDGFDWITIGHPDGNHIIDIGNPGESVTYNDPLVISAPNKGGEVHIGGNFIGIDDASLMILGSGNTTHIGDGNGPYPNLIVTVPGDLVINDSIVIHGDTTLESTNGNISITGSVQGAAGGHYNLTLRAGKSINIGGAVGGGGNLQNVTVETATNVTFQNAVNLTGAFTINTTGAVSLNGSIKTTGSDGSPAGANGGEILLRSTDAGAITLKGKITANGGAGSAPGDNGGAGGVVTIINENGSISVDRASPALEGTLVEALGLEGPVESYSLAQLQR